MAKRKALSVSVYLNGHIYHRYNKILILKKSAPTSTN